jgi:nitrogen fixation/metabolism regulation signal transduction histidine kinase
MDSLWLIASVFIFLVFYKNAIAFNQIALWFIRIGAVVQLVLLYFILRKGYSLIKNLKEGFMGLNNGYKMGLLLILVLICAIIYAHQEAIANWALNLYSNFNFASFNPFKMS